MYDFLIIEDSHVGGVRVRSTDHTIGNFLYTELSKHIKNVKAVVEAETISGQPYAWKFSNLSGKDNETAWWMMTQVSHNGWEPFATSGAYYQFRRKRG